MFFRVPEQVKNRYYGCGIVVPLGITGKTVLDLGSGSGLDCYVCAALVGPKGRFVGVDMTEEQLKVARDNIEL
jgi:tRNA A58 N-methylase Trm61